MGVSVAVCNAVGGSDGSLTSVINQYNSISIK